MPFKNEETGRAYQPDYKRLRRAGSSLTPSTTQVPTAFRLETARDRPYIFYSSAGGFGTKASSAADAHIDGDPSGRVGNALALADVNADGYWRRRSDPDHHRRKRNRRVRRHRRVQ